MDANGWFAGRFGAVVKREALEQVLTEVAWQAGP
jgi:hypothetical protein